MLKVMLRVMFKVTLILGLVISPTFVGVHEASAKAKEEYVVFDGRMYNSKYYPRIEIIEWTEQNQSTSHMEFQNYTKRVPIELSFEFENKLGKNVMLVKYFIPERNEYLCRRVLAPGHFKEGKPFYYYKDQTDKDMDVIFVSQIPLPEKEGRQVYKPKPFTMCEEPKAEEERLPANEQSGSVESSQSQGQGAVQENAPEQGQHNNKYKPGKTGGITKKGTSVPFGDL